MNPGTAIKLQTMVTACALAWLISCNLGCQSAYYAAYEQFGVYKRDLLKEDRIRGTAVLAVGQPS